MDELPAPDGEEYYAMALLLRRQSLGQRQGHLRLPGPRPIACSPHGPPRADHRPGEAARRRRDAHGRQGGERGARDDPLLARRAERLHRRRRTTCPRSTSCGRGGARRRPRVLGAGARREPRLFAKAAHPKTGLVPNLGELRRHAARLARTGHRRSWRTPGACAMNWSVDWSWWAKDPRQRELSDRLQAFFESQGLDDYGDNWTTRRHAPARPALAGARGDERGASLAAADAARARRSSRRCGSSRCRRARCSATTTACST